MNVKSIFLGAALLASSSTAFADQFYIDVGTDFDPGSPHATAAGVTTTGWLDEMLYEYSSTTVVTDADVNGPDDGDSIVTTGGFIDGDPASLATNRVTGFSPGEIAGLPFTPSDNGFGSWGLTFQFELTGSLGPGLTTDYNTGSITFYYYDSSIVADTSLYIELFTINVLTTTNTFGGPSIRGEIASFGPGTVNGVAAEDVFNVKDNSFGSLADDLVQIIAAVDFNTDPSQVTVTNNFDGTFTLTGEHDGSISFAVPEPSSLAVLGLGLLGAAGFGRRRRK